MSEHGFTLDRVMFYASGRGGLSGECQRIWPASYLATRHVENDGRTDMDPDKARCVKILLAQGWIERRERRIEVPEDTQRFSMFYGEPAHTLISVTYHVTDKGRSEWGRAT